MQLTGRVHLIGSGEPSLLETDPLDSQVYLVRGENGMAVIDTGAGRSVDRILANVVDDGLDPAAIRWVFVTHAHADHAGGAAAWSDRLPEARVAVSAESADWLRRGDEEATSVDVARRAGIYPPDYRLRPARIDRELEDGETIDLDAALTLTIVATPGHAKGHLAFLLRDGDWRIVFSGDALFPGGRILMQDTWDCDLHASLRSVERIAALAPHSLLAGHLGPVVEDAASHVAMATDRIRRLLPPELLA
jgi:hydroxyacylglutathione hydrolase